MINEIMNNTRNIIKIILAISTAAIAIPVKPNMPAMTDSIKKMNTQVIIANVVPATYKTNEIINMIKNIKKMIFAMPTDTAAMPENPRMAATVAIRRKVNTQPIMCATPRALLLSYLHYTSCKWQR